MFDDTMLLLTNNYQLKYIKNNNILFKIKIIYTIYNLKLTLTEKCHCFTYIINEH